MLKEECFYFEDCKYNTIGQIYNYQFVPKCNSIAFGEITAHDFLKKGNINFGELQPSTKPYFDLSHLQIATKF